METEWFTEFRNLLLLFVFAVFIIRFHSTARFGCVCFYTFIRLSFTLSLVRNFKLSVDHCVPTKLVARYNV